MGFIKGNKNYQKAFILNGDASEWLGAGHDMQNRFAGGLGNLNAGTGNSYVANLDGFNMFYLGANYKAPYDINLSILAAMSTAYDTPDGVLDDHGIEYNARLSWRNVLILQPFLGDR